MQGLEDYHLTTDLCKSVDGLEEIVLVVLRPRHLRKRVKELVIDVQKVLLGRRK